MLSDVPADGYSVEIGRLEPPEQRGQASIKSDVVGGPLPRLETPASPHILLSPVPICPLRQVRRASLTASLRARR